MGIKSAFEKFRGSGFARNWMWPVLGAAIGAAGNAAYQMYETCEILVLGVLPSTACFDEVKLIGVALSAAFGLLATKFKALAGKDQPWFDHED